MGVLDEIKMTLFCPRCGHKYKDFAQTKQLRNAMDTFTLKLRCIDICSVCPKCKMLFNFDFYPEDKELYEKC